MTSREERLPGEPEPLDAPSGADPDSWKTRKQIERAKAGDLQSRNELFERYYPRVLRLVQLQMRGLRADYASPEDVVNDTMITWLEKLQQFEPEHRGSLIAYLQLIAERKIKDLRARASSRRRLDVKLDGSQSDGDMRAAIQPSAKGPGPLSDMIVKDQKERFDELVAQLDERQRSLVILRLYLDVEWAEVATQLGYPNEHAAQEALGRVRRKLRASMGLGD